jgi:hypothetical protein
LRGSRLTEKFLGPMVSAESGIGLNNMIDIAKILLEA